MPTKSERKVRMANLTRFIVGDSRQKERDLRSLIATVREDEREKVMDTLARSRAEAEQKGT